ncbi:MAG: orotate phosphoribosyltransferase [Cytophagales bacterium]
MNKEVSTNIASSLLEIEAIKLRPSAPFKWSSGWNSPIYCDNRFTLSFPELRTYIKNCLVDAIKEHFPEAESIAGVATAGIPQGALVAEALNLPFLYVRPKPKDHGMENLIEGKITKDQKVVVIEDLISTGGSSLKATEALKDAGFNVLGMVAIFTYGFETANENFKKAAVKLVTLSNYSSLIEVVKSQNLFSDEELNSLNRWRLAPEKWNK